MVDGRRAENEMGYQPQYNRPRRWLISGVSAVARPIKGRPCLVNAGGEVVNETASEHLNGASLDAIPTVYITGRIRLRDLTENSPERLIKVPFEVLLATVVRRHVIHRVGSASSNRTTTDPKDCKLDSVDTVANLHSCQTIIYDSTYLQACVLEVETYGDPFVLYGRCVVSQPQPNAQDNGVNDASNFANDADRSIPTDGGVRMTEQRDTGPWYLIIQILLID